MKIQKFISFAMALVLCGSVLLPLQSKAAVGLVVASRSTAISGGVVTGVGAAVGGVSYVLFAGGTGVVDIVLGSIMGGTGLLVGGAVAVVGLVILDDNGEGRVSYTAVTTEQARAVGLSAQEAAAFNANVETINALQSDILQRSAQIPNFDQEMAGQMWVQGLNELEVLRDAQAALVKITARALGAVPQ